MRSAAALLATALLSACPSFPALGPYRCERDADCPGDLRCETGACRACAPRRCADLGGACGRFDDGCGKTLDCGCEPGMACARRAGGDCGCRPEVEACAAEFPACGAVEAACGPLACTCPPGFGCAGGACECEPRACGPLSCGGLADGCGGRLDCGACAPPAFCGAAAPGECGRPPGCADGACGGALERYCGGCARAEVCLAGGCGRPAGCGEAECGPVAPGLACGDCEPGESCTGGRCEPSRRPFCFGPAEALPSPQMPGGAFAGPTGRFEGVAEVAQLVPGDRGCTRHHAVLLDERGAVVATATTPLPSSRFPEPDPPCSTPRCAGEAGRPSVRPDGLEMFFVASYPCGRDPRLYLSHRGSTSEPWSLPVLVSAVDVTDLPEPRTVALLGPDLLVLSAEGGLVAARRPSGRPGDARFAVAERIPIAGLVDGDRATPTGLACDGEAVLFTRGGERERVARLAPILGWAPLSLGADVEVAFVGASKYLDFVEGPGCAWLWVADRNRDRILAERRARVGCGP